MNTNTTYVPTSLWAVVDSSNNKIMSLHNTRQLAREHAKGNKTYRPVRATITLQT